MLSLTHENSSSERTATPLNAAEEIQNWIQRDDPPKPPPKKAFSLHIPAAHPAETAFRHSGWKSKRKQVRACLASVETNKYTLDRFDQCGGECVVEYSKEAGKHRLKANYCHSRHCEPCMRAKANKLAGNLRSKLGNNAERKYRFITLTIKHSDTPLIDQIKRLYKCFKALRASKNWKRTQHGGAAILEVKWIAKTRRWHPHIHIVAEGIYLDKHDLSKAWLKATGDSQIVDIRELTDSRHAAHYVAKYITKGTSTDVWTDADASQEWILAMKSVRTCLTYGTWRGFKLTTTDAKFSDWKPVYTLRGLITDVEAGETAALHILCKLEGYRLDDEADKKGPRPAS